MKSTPLGASSGISASVLQLIHCCYLIINYIDDHLSVCFRVHLIDNSLCNEWGFKGVFHDRLSP